jgi:hypothetical protein
MFRIKDKQPARIKQKPEQNMLFQNICELPLDYMALCKEVGGVRAVGITVGESSKSYYRKLAIAINRTKFL